MTRSFVYIYKWLKATEITSCKRIERKRWLRPHAISFTVWVPRCWDHFLFFIFPPLLLVPRLWWLFIDGRQQIQAQQPIYTWLSFYLLNGLDLLYSWAYCIAVLYDYYCALCTAHLCDVFRLHFRFSLSTISRNDDDDEATTIPIEINKINFYYVGGS